MREHSIVSARAIVSQAGRGPLLGVALVDYALALHGIAHPFAERRSGAAAPCTNQVW
jgi:hypothetical protein